MFFLFICKLHLKWTKILSNFTAWACIETTCFHHPELVPCKIIRTPEWEKFCLWDPEAKSPSSTERESGMNGVESRIQNCLGLLDAVGNQGIQNKQTVAFVQHSTLLFEGEQRTRSTQTDSLRSLSLWQMNHILRTNHTNSVTMRSIKFISTIAMRVKLEESRSNISSLLFVKLRDRTFINFRGKR